MTVPAPPEDDRKPPEDIPDPELNPMTNTLLAQNMGRWAEVYFTTPAEKRDEAVQELLRELKTGVKSLRDKPAETSIPTVEDILKAKAHLVELEKRATNSNRQSGHDHASSKAEEQPQIEELVCPACLSKNNVGQRFCGLCGFSLITDRPSEHASEPTRVAPPPPPSEPVRDGNDWTWLHEKNLSELAHSQQKRGGRKYMVVLLIVLSAFLAGYLWWRSSLGTSAAGEKSKETVEQTTRSADSLPRGMEHPTAESHPSSTHGASSQATNPEGTADEKNVSSPDSSLPSGTTSSSDSLSSKTTISSIAEGVQELEKGRAYLEGRGVPKDTALAAKWLWKSVAKKNTEAVVILSGMYASGEGVPKSCDQARLLLSAAAQEGSDEAREKLKDVVLNCR